MRPAEVWPLLKEAGIDWWSDNAPHWGAALAFYATFALAPLLIISVAIAGLAFGHDAAEGRLLAQLSNLTGREMGAALQVTIADAREPGAGIAASMVGGAMTLLGAVWLFGELHEALNAVWKIPPQPAGGAWRFVKYHLRSLAMAFGTATLLFLSLVLNAAWALLKPELGDWASFWLIAEAVNLGATLAVTTLLFAMIYRFLPDVAIGWHDVWIGSAVTSLLFILGKHLLAMYMSRTAWGSAFGAAGSLAAILVWLYYSAQIFLLGAEVTKVYVWRRSRAFRCSTETPRGRETRKSSV